MEMDTGMIKNIICSNFDSSPKHYDRFEQEHGLFGHLTRELARVSGVKEGMTVYDIGCGTGGTVGMNWLRGVFDQAGETDLFRSAKEAPSHFIPYGRGIADMATLPGILKKGRICGPSGGRHPHQNDLRPGKRFLQYPGPIRGPLPEDPLRGKVDIAGWAT